VIVVAAEVAKANPIPWQFLVPIFASVFVTLIWFFMRMSQRHEDREN
jgi:hypothetical protein